MTVRELIDILECLEPHTEVRLAFQPSYPLQYYCVGTVSREEFGGADDYAEHAGSDENEVVWLLASSTEVRDPDGSPYFPSEAWDWREY